ncbi:hypothetical protein C1646_774943 [Rhizophagus diaphanus]|nr:hypothetical protein C1646_774943 [Rhizophagus diaphanus] [Rhizophagus sp. MUCL 43196]
MYFINEKDMMKAIYDSTMNEDLGKGLQIKGQDETIDKDGGRTIFDDLTGSTAPKNDIVDTFNQLNSFQ